MADYKIIGSQKTFGDYQQEEKANSLKEALTNAQIAKAGELDVNKMGQMALVKKLQGLPTTPEEDAIAQVYNASTQGLLQDFQGNVISKPGVLDRLGMNGMASQSGGANPRGNFVNNVQPPQNAGATGDMLSDIAPPGMPQVQNEWDKDYQTERARLLGLGDRMAAHQLDIDYAKNKTSMNEQQSNAATYADRMANAESVLTDPDKIKAYSDPVQQTISLLTPGTHWFGNYLNSAKFQSLDQAQKDFITAKLRKESGAAINAGEFATDEKTFLPKASDSTENLAQKAAAREIIKNGMARAAGPAYKPAVVPQAPAKLPVIPIEAAKHLRSNPSLAGDFDAKYGKGAAKYVLGQ